MTRLVVIGAFLGLIAGGKSSDCSTSSRSRLEPDNKAEGVGVDGIWADGVGVDGVLGLHATDFPLNLVNPFERGVVAGA